MRRDRLTFGMMIGIPLIQLMLFGFAINNDPKNLPAAVVLGDRGPFGRAVLYALKNSNYFRFTKELPGETAAEEALARGDVQFVVTIPEEFTRRFLRGDRPALLVEADATDPSAIGNALRSVETIALQALKPDLKGPLAELAAARPPVEVRVHPLYNPEGLTRYNIVSGLMGIVLTMTMVMITGLAITRERESGTMENLLSMPTRPLEVMLGKIVPYIFVGYIQILLILLAAHFIFQIPVEGSVVLLLCLAFLFITANLSVGVTISTIAQNQRQAMQMSFFFFLPSILLSGFMFPFRGMPGWAQTIGSILPLTHFLPIVRGILLKGSTFTELLRPLGAIILFTLVVLTVGVKRYRRTLD